MTQGILEADTERISKEGYCHAFWADKKGHKCDSFLYKKDFEKDKEAAIAKAEQMRQKKISSLKRQIEKLEKMKFE